MVQVPPPGPPPPWQLVPESSHVPAVPGSKTTPFNAMPGLFWAPKRGVITVVWVGVKETEAVMFWAAMAFGLSLLGKVPTAWSGRPLATIERCVLLQDQRAVAVALTEGELLKRLEA